MTTTAEPNLFRPQKAIGTPEDIPATCETAACRNLTPEQVAKRLNWEFAEWGECGARCKPGVCRFCGANLPVRHVSISEIKSGPVLYPVFQCDRAARMWPAAQEIRARWKREREARERAALKAATDRPSATSAFDGDF